MSDTPETDEVWGEFCLSDNNTEDAEKLKTHLRKLERERDEARRLAEDMKMMIQFFGIPVETVPLPWED